MILAASASSRQALRRTCSHQEEVASEIRRVLGAGCLRGLKGRGGAGDGRGNGGTVGREGLILDFASVCDLGAATRSGTCRPGLHDEGDALPQAVDVGATELVALFEAAFHLLQV